MRVSLVSGLLLVAILALVFVPRALQYQGVQPPYVTLNASGLNPFVITVATVSKVYALTEWRGELSVLRAGEWRNASLGPDLTAGAWAAGNVTFVDADGDGALSVGDQFRIAPEPGSGWSYTLLAFWKPRDGDTSGGCPCAAGRVDWMA